MRINLENSVIVFSKQVNEDAKFDIDTAPISCKKLAIWALIIILIGVLLVY